MFGLHPRQGQLQATPTSTITFRYRVAAKRPRTEGGITSSQPLRRRCRIRPTDPRPDDPSSHPGGTSSRASAAPATRQLGCLPPSLCGAQSSPRCVVSHDRKPTVSPQPPTALAAPSTHQRSPKQFLRQPPNKFSATSRHLLCLHPPTREAWAQEGRYHTELRP